MSARRLFQLCYAPLVGAAVGVAVFFISGSTAGQYVKLFLIDYGYRLRISPDHSPSVVFVAVDDKALATYPEPLTEWGSRFASAIERLERLEASAIGFDFVMPNPLPEDRAHHDRQLALAIRNSDRVILSSLWKGDTGSDISHVRPKPVLYQGLPDPELRVGFVNNRPDVDGRIRRSHLFLNANDANHYSFATLLAAKHLGVTPSFKHGTIHLGESRPLQTDDEGAIWISYRQSPINTVVVSLADLVDPNTPDEVLLPKVRGRVVIIGPKFAESQDYHATPFDNNTTGSLLVGAAVETIVGGDPPFVTYRWILLCGIVIVGIVHGSLVWWWRRIRTLLPLSLIVAMLCVAATVLCLVEFNTIFPGSAFGTVILATYVCRCLPFPKAYDAFISYRHEGDRSTSIVIRDRLAARHIHVFLDVISVDEPEFAKQLERESQRAPNFILLLSPGALDRCANENDWLRREIAGAIAAGRKMVPVLFEEFEMPSPDDLPKDIAQLTRFYGVSYPREHVESVIAKLARLIKVGVFRRIIPDRG